LAAKKPEPSRNGAGCVKAPALKSKLLKSKLLFSAHHQGRKKGRRKPCNGRDQCELLRPPAPGETGVSLDWGTVVGLEGFKFGVGALGAPRPPTTPPDEFPVTPVPAAPPPVPPPAPPLCAHAPTTMPNVSAAPSARTPICRFIISSFCAKKLCAPERKRCEAELVPASSKLKRRPRRALPSAKEGRFRKWGLRLY
jgi:hypothetical protein